MQVTGYFQRLADEWHGADRDAFRRRTIGIALALLIELLIVLAILSLGRGTGGGRVKGEDLSAFNLSPGPAKQEEKAEAKAAPAATANAVPPPPIPPQLFPAPNRVKAPPPTPYVKVTSDEYKAMDITGFARADGAAAADAGVGAKAGGAGGAIGPGEGPGGEPIYPVAWYREPTDAELRPYLKEAKRVPPGAWAEIACRMIDHYHVENCRQLRESDPGSGMARALRLASWQFLVQPPRIGGKVQLGTWVRIRFDFRGAPAEPTESALPGASEGE